MIGFAIGTWRHNAADSHDEQTQIDLEELGLQEAFTHDKFSEWLFYTNPEIGFLFAIVLLALVVGGFFYVEI